MQRSPRGDQRQESRPPRQDKIVCHLCQGKGHFYVQPSKKYKKMKHWEIKKMGVLPSKITNLDQNRTACNHLFTEALIATMVTENQARCALIDADAQVCLVKKSILNKLSNYETKTINIRMQGVLDGSSRAM